MGMSAPWRALEASDEAVGESTRKPRPSPLLLMVGAAAILVAASVGVVAFAEMKPGGQVEVVGGPGETAGRGASASTATIVVQVAGAVVRPGVYTLPAGSRVGDAINKAGGYSTDVDPRAAESKLNLAAKLQDAQLITVPRRGDAATNSSKPESASVPPGGPINLNAATADQLDELPGIGPATAAKIIASREQLPFTSVDDLVSRKLVAASTLAKFRDQVTV